MSHRTLALIFSGLAAALLAVLIVLLILCFAPQSGGSVSASGEIDAAEQTVQPTELPDAPEVTPNSNPSVSLQEQPVPEGYFEDALFIGDALVQGLQLNDYDDVLTGADFIVDDDLTVRGDAYYLDDMEYDAYGKVYICLGMEELLADEEDIQEAYLNLLSEIRRHEPNAVIYIMSLTPVSEYKSSVSSYYSQRLVRAFNDVLRGIARDGGAYYMDIYASLCDENGYLPSEVTVDGIHFVPAHYEGWFDYLQSHYVTEAEG